MPRIDTNQDRWSQVCDHAARLANRFNGGLALAERYIERVGEASGTLGIEGISEFGRSMEYINTGDTYSTTVICEDGVCETGTWGGWYEQAEEDHLEETGEQHCCYCGTLAECEEHTGRNWHGWACEYCRENH